MRFLFVTLVIHLSLAPYMAWGGKSYSVRPVFKTSNCIGLIHQLSKKQALRRTGQEDSTQESLRQMAEFSDAELGDMASDNFPNNLYATFNQVDDEDRALIKGRINSVLSAQMSAGYLYGFKFQGEKEISEFLTFIRSDISLVDIERSHFATETPTVFDWLQTWAFMFLASFGISTGAWPLFMFLPFVFSGTHSVYKSLSQGNNKGTDHRITTYYQRILDLLKDDVSGPGWIYIGLNHLLDQDIVDQLWSHVDFDEVIQANIGSLDAVDDNLMAGLTPGRNQVDFDLLFQKDEKGESTLTVVARIKRQQKPNTPNPKGEEVTEGLVAQ